MKPTQKLVMLLLGSLLLLLADCLARQLPLRPLERPVKLFRASTCYRFPYPSEGCSVCCSTKGMVAKRLIPFSSRCRCSIPKGRTNMMPQLSMRQDEDGDHF